MCQGINMIIDKKITMLLAVLLVLIASYTTVGIAASGQQIYYVDGNNGNNFNNGSLQSPFKTIQKACDTVNPGDVVIVQQGVYFESIKMTCSGTAQAPIIFRAAQSDLHSVTITGADKSIRQKNVLWTLEDNTLHLYSIPLDHEPARVLYDDVDLFPYKDLDSLKNFIVYPTNGPDYMVGPKHGYVYDAGTQKLYVRLHQDGKYGSKNPNEHMMAVAPQAYKKLVVNGKTKNGFKGNIIGPGSYNWGIETEGAAYIVLEGFTFETPGFAGVYIRGSDVTVRSCWFRGVRGGVNGGSKYTDDAYSSDNITVEHCNYTQFPTFEDAEEIINDNYLNPKVTQNTFYWWQRKGAVAETHVPSHLDYETGCITSKMGDNWILRNNYIYSCFDGLSYQAMDKMTLTDDSGKTRTYGCQGLELYNNRFEKCVDNAIEFENHGTNLSIHNNEFINIFAPISWQPLGGKPWPTNIKVYRNLIYASEGKGRMWYEKAYWPTNWFKAGAQYTQWQDYPWMADEPVDPVTKVPLDPVRPEENGVFFFNNTIFMPYSYFLERCNGAEMLFDNFKFTNNIFVGHIKPVGVLHKGEIAAGSPFADGKIGFSFDHNLFAADIEGTYNRSTDIVGNQGNSLKTYKDILFKNTKRQQFELLQNSPAVGKGVNIPEEPASSIDLGAVPYGHKWDIGRVGPLKFSDVNGDGTVNLLDFIKIKRLSGVDKQMPEYIYECDKNNDGIIDEVDIMLVTQEINK